MDRETLLEKYLQDQLTETELLEFNALLKSDLDFKEEVEFQMDVKRAVTAEEDSDFAEMLSNFESEARATELKTDSVNAKTKRLPPRWLVAASVVVLVGLTYFFSVNQTTDPHDLFSQNFRPYRNVTHPITRGNEAANTKDQAFSAYSRGDYKTAVPLFTELYTSDKEPYYLFYKANALIQLNRGAEAVPLLQEHLNTDDSLIDKSQWYLAMAYLQMEDTENAKGALNKVVANGDYKLEEAKQLLDAL